METDLAVGWKGSNGMELKPRGTARGLLVAVLAASMCAGTSCTSGDPAPGEPGANSPSESPARDSTSSSVWTVTQLADLRPAAPATVELVKSLGLDSGPGSAECVASRVEADPGLAERLGQESVEAEALARGRELVAQCQMQMVFLPQFIEANDLSQEEAACVMEAVVAVSPEEFNRVVNAVMVGESPEGGVVEELRACGLG